MLRDASVRDTSVELFGRRTDAPFLLAPIGVAEMAHRDADLATARAAAAEGVPMIFSNQASVAMERCAAEMGDGRRWFQLYWSTSNELVESFIARAQACGCEAIVVTLDTTMLGWRPRDLDLGSLPFLRGMGIAQYTSDPVFRRLVAEAGVNPNAPRPKVTPAALSTLLLTAAPAYLTSECAAVRRDLLAALPVLGRSPLPARADAAADRAEGDLPPG